MDMNTAGFILSIVAIVMATSIIKTIIRARYGITVRRRRRHGGEEEVPSAARQVELLDSENAALKGQVTRLEERIAVLERIATDRSRRLADEIDALN
jgi:cell division protein FtsB